MCQIGGRGLIGGSQRVIYHAGRQLINNNGTAVVVGYDTRRSNRPVNCPVRPGNCPGARRVWRVFLQSRYTADRAIERSRYKFYKWLKISHVSRMLVNGHLRSIALQVVKEPENSHGTEFNLRADARVRVQKPLRICHVSRSKGKNRDK